MSLHLDLDGCAHDCNGPSLQLQQIGTTARFLLKLKVDNFQIGEFLANHRSLSLTPDK